MELGSCSSSNIYAWTGKPIIVIADNARDRQVGAPVCWSKSSPCRA